MLHMIKIYVPIEANKYLEGPENANIIELWTKFYEDNKANLTRGNYFSEFENYLIKNHGFSKTANVGRWLISSYCLREFK